MKHFLSMPLWGNPTFLVVSAIVLVMAVLCVTFAVVAVLYRIRNNRVARLWERLEVRWEPIVLSVLGGQRSPEQAWALVRPKERLYFIEYLFRYSGRVRGGYDRTLATLAAPFLEPIATRTRIGNTERRARAVETVAALGLPARMHCVTAALNDPAPLVVMIAARALARPQYREHADAIIDRLEQLSSWSQRHLATMFVRMGPEVADTLRDVLGDPDRPILARRVAAEALSQLHDPRAASDACAIITDEQADRELRTACLRILSHVGGPDHVEPIREATRSEDTVVRAVAMKALAGIASERTEEALKAGMNDESRWVAISAARGLRKAGREDLLLRATSPDDPRAHLVRQVLGEEAYA